MQFDELATALSYYALRASSPKKAKSLNKFLYPAARQMDQVDEYHGESVSDPFRWLEDPDSEETQAWVTAQNRLTDSHLATCDQKGAFYERMKSLYNYEKVSCPFRRESWVFFYKNNGLQNQSVLFKQQGLEGEPSVLLDPNTLREDGTAALKVASFTQDGSKLAYGVSLSGSDWFTVYVRDVATGEDTADKVEWVKFSSVVWTHDNQGFYYCRYPKPASLSDGDAQGEDSAAGTEVDAASNQSVYFHRLGEPASEDKCVYADPSHPKWMYGPEITTDGRFLILGINDSCDPVNRVYIADLQNLSYDSNGYYNVVKLVDNIKAGYDYIGNDGLRFYFKTNLSAPRYRVVAITLPSSAFPSADADADADADAAAAAAGGESKGGAEEEGEDDWVLLSHATAAGPGLVVDCELNELIPEHSVDVLSSIQIVAGDNLVAAYMHDAQEEIRVFSLSDGAHRFNLPLPAPGTVASITGRRVDDALFFKFTSFLYPGSIFHHDFSSAQTSLFRETTVPGFDPALFVTRQVFFTSKDGTKVPMFLVHKKGLNKPAPTLLYGYGGFNISLTPYFSSIRVPFVQNVGGVVAIANLRGGGEYGNDWHQAGTRTRKQNVFDDFIAAGEYLVSNGITSTSKLAIMGGSNGGLLVSACAGQRPDLFAAAVAQVPVTDMMRFHKFTIGYAWCSDFGCADGEDAAEFRALRAYSPLHNVAAPAPGSGVQYPSLLVTTADHDDRVVPLHSYKFVAAVQAVVGASPQQTNPLLIRVEQKAGHGAGKPTEKVLDEYSDVYAFISNATGGQWTQ